MSHKALASLGGRYNGDFIDTKTELESWLLVVFCDFCGCHKNRSIHILDKCKKVETGIVKMFQEALISQTTPRRPHVVTTDLD
jgi:hypothetical protein